jgi:hypothetical protein
MLRALGERRAQAAAATAHFVLAASFANFLLGSVVRRLVVFWVRDGGRATELLMASVRDHLQSRSKRWLPARLP